MPRYIIPFNGEIEVDAESQEDASEIAHRWRRFTLHLIVQENYDSIGVRRMEIKPMPEVTEVTDEYLASLPRKMIIRREKAIKAKLELSQRIPNEAIVSARLAAENAALREDPSLWAIEQTNDAKKYS